LPKNKMKAPLSKLGLARSVKEADNRSMGRIEELLLKFLQFFSHQ